jgi:hypothetical protein
MIVGFQSLMPKPKGVVEPAVLAHTRFLRWSYFASVRIISGKMRNIHDWESITA